VSTVRIGLLECDHVRAAHEAIAGDYAEMFRTMLAAVDPQVQLVRYDVRRGPLPEAPGECDGWICSGSRASVYDDEPWIHALCGFVERAHVARTPFVGICFGHQLLAHALGGRTTRAAAWGVGAAAADIVAPEPWMQPRRSSVTLLYSHQDQVVDLPPGGRVLAAAPHCPVAMLAVGDHAVGVQAHPEFGARYLDALLEDRVDRLGEEVTAAARASLSTPTDAGDVAGWIVAFLRAGAGRPIRP
jgi:GMP synthase-like glutamine amidotransferase